MSLNNTLSPRPVFAAETGAGSSHSLLRRSQLIDMVVIPVGGLGSRMFPLTNAIPKNLLAVGDKTLIDYAVEAAELAGVKKIVIVGSDYDKPFYEHHFAPRQVIIDKINKPGQEALKAEVEKVTRFAPMIEFVVQDEPRGLGHAVLQAASFVSGSFGVILPDDLILNGTVPDALVEMVNEYEGGIAIAAMPVSEEETKRFGVFAPAKEPGCFNPKAFRATGIVEKPQSNPPSTLAAMGCYILPPEVMGLLETQEPGAGGEIQLTDAIDRLVQEYRAFLFGVRFSGTRYDCGTKPGFRHAQREVCRLLDEADAALTLSASAEAQPKPGR